MGRVNMAAMFTFLAGLSNLVVWMNAKKFGVLIFYAFLQGRRRLFIWSSHAHFECKVHSVGITGRRVSNIFIILRPYFG
jgi:hypothetical protein